VVQKNCTTLFLQKRFTVKYLSVRIYCNKFETKRHQNCQSLLKHTFTVLCETQHSGACLLPTLRDSLNVIIIVENI